MLAFTPFEGSVVTFTHFYNIEIGNFGWGEELSHNLKLSCISDLFYSKFSIIFSNSFKKLNDKWQFAKYNQ